jgi:hypothetical protein
MLITRVVHLRPHEPPERHQYLWSREKQRMPVDENVLSAVTS